MTLLGLLAASAASAAAASPLALSSNVNIVFDGDSITDDHLASGLDTLVAEALGGSLNGASVTTLGGLAVSGQSWADMANNASDVHAAWAAGKTNVLIVAEDTNSVFNEGKTLAQVLSDKRRYIDLVRATDPWIVVLWGNIPRGHGDEATYPGEAAKNQTLVDLNADAAANWRAYGAHAYVDVRTGVPMFDHDGTVAADFSTYQTYWNEAPPTTNAWDSLGWVHPKDGAYTAGSTPAVGKRAIAEKLAAVLTDGSLPSTP